MLASCSVTSSQMHHLVQPASPTSLMILLPPARLTIAQDVHWITTLIIMNRNLIGSRSDYETFYTFASLLEFIYKITEET